MSADDREPLTFGWGVSSFYGWGIYGLNLALQLHNHPKYRPVCATPFSIEDVVIDPLRARRIAAMHQESTVLWEAMSRANLDHIIEGPCLHGLGNDLAHGQCAHGALPKGNPMVGVLFMEDPSLTWKGRHRLEDYDLIVAGSHWNEGLMRDEGVRNVVTIMQGVDTSLFHPAPRAGLFPGRFVIFSGGKLEFRKGQDIVLAAFRAFQQRHPEALLVTAWHSPWTHLLAAGAVGRTDIEAPRLGRRGEFDAVAWAVNNGIPADSVIALGQTPNVAMPHILRECDVALFPNRAEGGTNLAAMECMACGVPTILSENTGHLDLMQWGGLADRMSRQSKVTRVGLNTEFWGESDVEEAVERLEYVYRQREAVLAQEREPVIGILTWKRQIGALIEAIDRL